MFGSAAKCLFLILVDFQGIILLVFGKFLHAVGNRWNSLLDRLCYPGNFNHSHQITQLEKIICRTLVQKFGTEEQLPHNLQLRIIMLSCHTNFF